jgi:hypothetical protein
LEDCKDWDDEEEMEEAAEDENVVPDFAEFVPAGADEDDDEDENGVCHETNALVELTR